MKKEITTQILIRSTPEKIWNILTAIENYPNWNPFITSIQGEIKEGKKISISIKPPNGNKINFKPTIISIKNNKELSWFGTVIFKGIFDGKHKFELIDNKNGTTTFIHSEKFRGIFVWLFDVRKTTNGFNEMNKKLKELAEKE